MHLLTYNNSVILSYGHFLVTDTPWSQGVRIKEAALYLGKRDKFAKV